MKNKKVFSISGFTPSPLTTRYTQFKKLNHMKNQHHIDKIEEYVYKCLQKDELNDSDLVQIYS
jgi:hypothetical protein